MKQQFLTALAIVALIAGMTSTAAAASDDGQRPADVNVTIAAETAIDVHPQQLLYENVNPGQTAGASVEDRSFGSVELENVGSTDIERVWVNATQTNSQSPFFGSSNPADFNAANFLQLKPTSTSGPLEGDPNNWTYVNRKEFGAFNDTLKPEYINAPDNAEYYVSTNQESTATASDVAVGRFRMGDIEYFWAIPTQGTGCDGTSDNTFNSMFIAKEPHNASFTKPIDFTANTTAGGENPDGGSDPGYDSTPDEDYHLYNISDLTSGGGSSSDYGILGAGTDGNNNGVALKDTEGTNSQIRVYDVLTECDTENDGDIQNTDAPNVIRTRYNVEAGNDDDLASDANGLATQYLITSSQLEPSQSVKLDVRIMVPRGIPQGVVSEGVLRVVASTTN